MNVPPTGENRHPSAWLFSPALDLLVGCGAWSLPLLALTFFVQRDHATGAAFAFYLLAIFCNQPHYMATLHRAYHTAADFDKYRFFTVYVTALLALTIILVHFVPPLVPWIVTLYLTWSPWHYTGQNFGIAQLFIRRAGPPAATPDTTARQLLYASYVASFGVWAVTLHAARDATDPNFISLGLPGRIATPLQLFLTLAFIGCAGAAFFRLARTLPSRALLAPAALTVTQFLWFVGPAILTRFGGFDLPASYFSAGALAFMHCAQYLWITTYYARREAASGAPPFRFTRYYLALVIGGIALFIPGPWVASRFLGHDFVESFLIFMALVNVHHFILDGAIWKLRDGRIARLLLGANASVSAAPDPTAPPPFGHHLGWLFGATPAARALRLAGAIALLALAALDQWQYYATTRDVPDGTLARAAALNPADPRPAFQRAARRVESGDLPAARRELEALVARYPHNAAAQHLLGRVLFALNDIPAALAHYDRMAEAYPADFSVAYNRGLAAAAANQRAKALASFESAVALAPANPSARLFLFQELVLQAQPARAVAVGETVFASFEADEHVYSVETYLAFCLDYADCLLASPPPAVSLETAAVRLQHAADIAAPRHLFRQTAALLRRLATLQEKLNRPADAARSRATAEQAEKFVL